MSKALVVTGASRGIGLATAQLFLAAGYQVINLARSACPLEHVVNITLDLVDLTAVQASKQRLQQALTNVSRVCLVHNAAYFGLDDVMSLSAETLQQSLTVNVVAPTLLTQFVLPFCQTASSVIYIGSTLSEKAVAGVASYVTAKHAVVGLMRATCQDLADKPLHTCCICPGFTDTEMLRERVGGDEQALQALAARVGAKRLIAADEIAQVVLNAAKNPVLNGAVIHANLGQLE